MNIQYCPGCEKDLPTEAFYKCVIGRNGSPCKLCQNERNKLYKQTHPKDKPRHPPITLYCQECNKEFLQPVRAQGGGKLNKFCSRRCCWKHWAKVNPEKKLKAMHKYEANPKNKEKKVERARQYRFKKYGLDEQFVLSELEKQNFKCQGCLCTINLDTARIDHNHTTKAVRGLLCDHCNWSLGHAKDSIETLERLIKYLRCQSIS